MYHQSARSARLTGRALFRVRGVQMRSSANLLPEGDWDADPNADQYLTTAQAAAEYNIAAETIRVWTHRGLIHVAARKHVGRRQYAMYHRDDLARVEREMRQSPNCRRAA